MDAEHIHEDADAGALFAGHGIAAVFDAHDPAVRRADGQPGGLRRHPLGIAEEVQSEPAQGQHKCGGHGPAEQSADKGYQSQKTDQGPPFGGDAATGFAHENISVKARDFLSRRRPRGRSARALEHVQAEMLRTSNLTACRFAKKSVFPLTSGRAALCRRLAFSLFQSWNALVKTGPPYGKKAPRSKAPCLRRGVRL